MELDEKWIRAHLPKELENQPIDCFSGAYLEQIRQIPVWRGLCKGMIDLSVMDLPAKEKAIYPELPSRNLLAF